jgi:two-component system, sensor histidine kinase RegB
MTLQPLLRPHLHSHPTLDTAIWFMHLRWVAVAGQLLAMAVVMWVLRIEIPRVGLTALVAVTATTNVIYALVLRHWKRDGMLPDDELPTYHIVSGLMLLDIGILTAMLYLSGGIANPFALFYFVNIAVAGTILAPLWAWFIWFVTVVATAGLIMRSETLIAFANSDLQSNGEWSITKAGYLVSFATCGGVITYFVTALTGQLKIREQALAEAEEARIRNSQLEALATLAAGAGHELASPLSTIAVVAKELVRSLEKHGAPKSDIQDVVLIRSELDRCRQILDRMTSAAGEAAGERLTEIAVQEFLNETMIGLREPQRVQCKVSETMQSSRNLLPVQATAQAIRNLLQNALDASQPGAEIVVQAELQGTEWKILVIDRGDGMTPEVLRRVGEPFFTTKEPGRGMGLGLYLTQNVLRRLGGKLSFKSRPGHGTTAEILLPTSRH